MEVIPVGREAVLVEVAGAAEALDLAQWLRARSDATEVVPAARTVLLDGVDPGDVPPLLAAYTPGAARTPGPLVEIAVTYDGPDLPRVAELTGLSVAEVVAAHTQARHVVAFCGFAPGFAYVAGSPFDVPRLATPRGRVEPGSVGLAGRFTGIYPSASPGGWQLIGHTEAVLWDPSRAEPALLPPGARVRFSVA